MVIVTVLLNCTQARVATVTMTFFNVMQSHVYYFYYTQLTVDCYPCQLLIMLAHQV
jgi:hypothetical protein